jgi:4-amino-4-deoxy-L-arabinose transferase-like glycosyltransferase
VIILLFILLLKAIFGILFVLYGDIYLAPDEAQYWLWSRFLDFGYYSKPPAITWEIALGTSVFGSTELGVRIGGITLSFFLGVATFYLAKASGLSEKRSIYSALILALCPIGILSSFAATTDLGFVLFWILAFTHISFSLKENKHPSFILLGLIILLGALFKWTMFLIWPVIIVGTFYYPALRSKRLIWTFFISLLALLPSLYWNYYHEFATFKHVAFQSVNQAKPNPFDFFIAQVGLFFPVFFAFFVIALYRLPKLTRPLRFVTAWAGIFMIVYIALAFKQKMQANWAVFAYPLAAVAAGHLISRVWMIIGAILSTMISLFVLFLPTLQQHSTVIAYSINPFKPSLGWPKLKEALQISGYDPQKHVLISDRYQTSSIASFYSQGQKRSYLLNLMQFRKNQFFFWPGLEKGASGFFIVVENRPVEFVEKIRKQYLGLLPPYFDQVGEGAFFPLFSYGNDPLKWALIFEVKGYTGLVPEETANY